ncbi:MAG: hypothetical protein IJG23_05855 [Clostridia bacterium]|nr:hypothetical protein [Clostridia bacterium]
MSLILGHRGASAYAPDNTRVSFEMAVQMGADGVETDIHLTKDGIPVIQHNYEIDRNSNGKGYVEEMTYEQLLQYDFGSWKGEAFRGERIMTLDECLEFADKHMRLINLELKETRQKNSPIVEKTIELVKKYKMVDRVLLSSFDHELMQKAQVLCPELLIGALYDEAEVNQNNIYKILEDAPQYVSDMGFDFANPHIDYLCEEGIVDKFTQKGIGVAVWTVDKPYIAQQCVERGVKCIITNKPDIISKAVREVCD